MYYFFTPTYCLHLHAIPTPTYLLYSPYLESLPTRVEFKIPVFP